MCRLLLIAASRRAHVGSTCFLVLQASRRPATVRSPVDRIRRAPELPGAPGSWWCRAVGRPSGPDRTPDGALPHRGILWRNATTLPDRGGGAEDREQPPRRRPRLAVILSTAPGSGNRCRSAADPVARRILRSQRNCHPGVGGHCDRHSDSMNEPTWKSTASVIDWPTRSCRSFEHRSSGVVSWHRSTARGPVRRRRSGCRSASRSGGRPGGRSALPCRSPGRAGSRARPPVRPWPRRRPR